MRHFLRFGSLVFLGGSSLIVACGSAPDSTGGIGGSETPPGKIAPLTQTTTDSAAGIHGTRLYGKNIAADHVVEMYEFTPGAVAIHESYLKDSGEAAFVDSMSNAKSLADVYSLLNPDEKTVPANILEADARAVKLATTVASAGKPPAPSSKEASTIGQEILPGASGTCSGDALGDNWGATWWINNFCNAGSFRQCFTNSGQVTSNEFSASWVNWRQFEGDFNLTGHTHGDHWHCDSWWPGVVACGWVDTVDWDYDVQPRHIESWVWNPASNAEAWGSSQCGHCDVALLWNQ
jgi:hypothetical protein